MQLIKIKEVMYRTSLSQASIYKRIQNGTFPKPVSLGARSVAWHEEEVSVWIRGVVMEGRV
ncbi:AlpA family phage regulatory protein [Vibrio sp. Hep-1b-8]|uniref:helix-turn-helix transcriptional regulator n=1 Tax=Vibrio sp. Hep-1b-8 TaxID=2144187 RepID=UPI0011108B19|nr:AlpA family phage regulatory protein [Vibrio sp. Hep-1b-8]TMX34629.1 transcriptional regulator [Vibrio sp. Hep-1b-8]